MVESACNPGLAAKPFQGQRILPDLLRKDQERFLLSRLSYRTEATCEDSPWTLVLCALLAHRYHLADRQAPVGAIPRRSIHSRVRWTLCDSDRPNFHEQPDWGNAGPRCASMLGSVIALITLILWIILMIRGVPARDF
jgi:hypothetical protein